LGRYPRKEADDAAALASESVDVLYLPDAAEMYPPDFSTSVEVRGVSEGGEGETRPGHFRGVATVVAKLFLQVSPDVAVFGQKDREQVSVVGQMKEDLRFPIRLLMAPSRRYPDRRWMSSRNLYPADGGLSVGDALTLAVFEVS